MKHAYRRLAILLLSIVAVTASASDRDAESTLKQFEGKVLVLRHPLQDSLQQYDAEGKALKGGDEGPWTIYGGVLIDKVTLSSNKVRLDGRRMLFQFLKGQFTAMEFKRLKRPVDPPFPPEMNLEIALDRALDSSEQAQTVLNRVFALNSADLLDSVPNFWRGLLKDRLIYDPLQMQEAEFRWQPPPSSPMAVGQPAQNAGPDATSSRPDAGKPSIFHVGPGVMAPKPLFTPEPKYSDVARYEKFQGVLVVSVIVGADGNVQSIRLVRALGMGLDESAQSMLQTWRFDPATRDGKPVAVDMNIEVSFNLY